MKIIDFNKPFVTLEDRKYIDHVFKNNKYADGYFQRQCENFIRKKIKSKFVALTQSCTSALEIAMILINLKSCGTPARSFSIRVRAEISVMCQKTKVSVL